LLFDRVSSKPDFPALDSKIIYFWRCADAFETFVENRRKEPFLFIGGPILANNTLDIHNAWASTHKYLFQRYQAMRGKDQRYQNGFDC